MLSHPTLPTLWSSWPLSHNLQYIASKVFQVLAGKLWWVNLCQLSRTWHSFTSIFIRSKVPSRLPTTNSGKVFIPVLILPPYRNSLHCIKKEGFNPTCCCFPSFLILLLLLFFLQSPQPLFGGASPNQPVLAEKNFNSAYFDLKIKSYLLCILFVVFEEPEHSFKGGQNDFLNTFLSLLQLNKVELWLVHHRGERKRHPWIKMGGPDCALWSHNAGVYCWNLLIALHCKPWEPQSGGKWFSSLSWSHF